jgi:hypothetical protein
MGPAPRSVPQADLCAQPAGSGGLRAGFSSNAATGLQRSVRRERDSGALGGNPAPKDGPHWVPGEFLERPASHTKSSPRGLSTTQAPGRREQPFAGHAASDPRLRAQADRLAYLISTICASEVPARMTSSIRLPMRARATGETYESLPFAGSASSSPTMR